jgi:hypothetical protein
MFSYMTKDQIDAVLDRVHSWPKERQEDAVQVLLTMEAEGTGRYLLSPEERADLEAALAEVARGEVASDQEVETVFARHRT